MENPSFDINSVMFRHEQPVQIRFNDVDVIGHVNNSIALSYYDLGKVAYFEAMGYKGIGSGDIDLVIMNVNVDYMIPIFMGDDIVVKTKVAGIGNKSVKLIQVIFDKKSQKIKSICRTVMCGFDPKTNTSLPISDEWRARIHNFEPDLA